MIDSLDLVIRQALTTDVPALVGHIGFQPPDDTWRQAVSAGTGIWLNCALVDLREDRTRRSNEVRIERDPLRRITAPFLLRCHYLMSAWNSAKESPAVPASVQEHRVLGQVVSALSERAVLSPASVLVPSELATIPTGWREASFDTEILPTEGFPKIAEYWGTMGRGVPWRPVVWLAITVPISPEPTDIDGIVLTITTSFGQGTPAVVEEALLIVGGTVTDAGGIAVDLALITLTTPSGQLAARAVSDSAGEFVLDSVVAGDYDLTARSATHSTLAPISVTLPTPVGGPLHLQFT